MDLQDVLCWSLYVIPGAAFSIAVIGVIGFWIKYLNDLRILRSMPGPPRTLFPLITALLNIRKMTKLSADPTSAQWLMKKANQEKFQKDGIYANMITSRTLVSVFRADLIEELLKSPDFTHKSIAYDNLKIWLGNGLLLSNGPLWKRQRRLLTPSFHFKILDVYEATMNSHILEEIQLMRKDPNLLKDVDLSKWATDCTMGILLETVMGMTSSDPASNREYIESLNKVAHLAAKRFTRPWKMIDIYYFNSAEGKTFLKAVEHLHQFTGNVISSKIKEFTEDPSKMEVKEGTKQAFLDMLITMHLKEKTISVEEMREQADTFMFAGHDTTGWGIAWVLYQIGLYPEIQQKVHEEIDEVFGDDRTRHITQEDLQQLKYFERVLKECQRMYPSVPGFSRKCTTSGAKLGPYTVPLNATVQVSVFYLHRDPQYFPDPEKFDPDRFLPENTRGRHAYAFLPFSAGPRNCIGQRFAMQELKISLVNVMRNFSLKSRDTRDKLELAGEIILRSKQGIHVTFEPR